MYRTSNKFSRNRRHGFTLIELLIVISILLILLTMTVMTVNFSRDSERVVGSALQIQSFLSGARDRAIQAKEPRGVRFFLDTDNYRAVTSMVYIDPANYWSDGNIQLRRWDADEDGVTDAGPVDIVGDGTADEDPTQVRVVAAPFENGWWELKRRGLLFDGLRMEIPKASNRWYTINTRLIDTTVARPAVQYLILDVAFADPGDTQVNQAQAFDSSGPEDYRIELPASVLPMDPVKLAENTIIDLDCSRLPIAWRPKISATPGGLGNFRYSQFMDVVFSPRGNVVGAAASAGVIHFYVCDEQDSITLKESLLLDPVFLADATVPGGLPAIGNFTANGSDLPTAKILTYNSLPSFLIPTNAIKSSTCSWLAGYADDDPYLVRDRRLVTLFTQTGAVSTHPVNIASDLAPDYDGFEDDPFLFAETGRTGR
jgi:prepilin-type N-terminal cleavage/methylation domain-containing protein